MHPLKRANLLNLNVSSQRVDKVYNIRNSPEYFLGKGNFGIVIKAEEKLTGQIRAIKIINKQRLETMDADLNLLANEFSILQELDHPNIVRLYEVYEDPKYVYFVMEYLQGWSLFDRLTSEEHMLTEDNNREIFYQLIKGLQYLHKNGVAHRDIKPENMIFVSEDSKQIKIIDFGVSKYFFSPKDPAKEITLRTQTGSIFYMAPEIISGAYDCKCDVWSAGVILYMLFAGEPPFNDEDQNVVKKKIVNIELDFEGEVWKNVSTEVINLIKNILTKSENRFTTDQILEDPWMKVALDAKKCVIDPSRLKKFFLGKAFCRYFLEIIAASSSETDNQSYGEFFVDIDEDGDGVITREDLVDGLQKNLELFDSQLPELIMKTYATNQPINYNNFLSVISAVSTYSNLDKRIEKAFKAIDSNGSGRITGEDVKRALCRAKAQEFKSESYWESIIKEIDPEGKGHLELNDVKAIMKYYVS
jgi:calcium-dependent protein kinase